MQEASPSTQNELPFSTNSLQGNDMQEIKAVAINGKNFCFPLTGILRVTEELLRELDKLLTNQSRKPKLQLEIIAPENAAVNLNLENIPTQKRFKLKSGFFVSIPWEQGVLPFLVKKNQLLLSLGNLQPIFIKNSVLMIHDAQVFITPKSYEKVFAFWHKFVMQVAGKRCKRILTVSNFSKEQLVKYGIAKPEKITVIHNGCEHILKTDPDYDVLKKFGLTDKSFYVAQSHNTLYKNIFVLLKAFATEPLKNSLLVLYGSKNKHDFEKLGTFVPPNVIFTGRVTDGELVGLIKSAKATLLPSTTEGFGLQPLESMQLGTPAIVAPCGALPEVCGDAALYADAYKPEEWIARMSELETQPALGENLIAKGKLQAQQFTWENAAKKLLDVLHEA